MNQILVTEKLYVTPELRKKKRMYKFNFIVSIVVIVILCSFYAHSEYARNKEQEVSQDILTGMVQNEIEVAKTEQESMDQDEENVWKIMIASAKTQIDTIQNKVDEANNNTTKTTNTTKKRTVSITGTDGKRYQSVGRIQIPKIGVNYAILDNPNDDEKLVQWLRISPCKFYGVDPNEIGNCSIAGHNYRNKRFFSKVLTLEVGDEIKITDINNRTIKYYVYNKYTVVPEDTSCLDEYIPGKRIITLITCTNDSKKRVIVHAKEA